VERRGGDMLMIITGCKKKFENLTKMAEKLP
jgi:translation initiation factor 1 (eIF-1/SUI1)